MSDKTGRVWLWCMAAVVLTGCAAPMYNWLSTEKRAPSSPLPPPGPATQPAARAPQPRTTATLAGDLERAIQLVMELRYEEGANTLMDLLPRLEAAQDMPRQGEATFWLGFCREKQGRRDRAVQLYQRVVQDFGDSPAAKQARQRLTDLSAGKWAPIRSPL